MSKALFTVLLALAVLSCCAQTKVGVFAGPQITSAKYTINGKKQSTTPKYGFELGVNAKVPFEGQLYFSPAVFYSLKGYDVKFDQPSIPPDSFAVDNNTSIHTLELGAMLQYDFSNRPCHFFARLGPSIDIQLAGKEKFNRSDRSYVEQNMVFSFTKYGRFGASMLLQFGYETKDGLTLTAHYTHGIGSVNNADFGPRIWHRVLGISIGKYLFEKK